MLIHADESLKIKTKHPAKGVRGNTNKLKDGTTMKLQEFLAKHNSNDTFTFVIAKAVEDEHAPGYHFEYRTTPIRTVWEWLTFPDKDEIVINPNHPPIDIPGNWITHYNKGWLKCCLITTESDFNAMYPHYEQCDRMLKWYDKIARDYVKGV